MTKMRLMLYALLCCALALSASNSYAKDSRDDMDAGSASFSKGHYAEAQSAFTHAAQNAGSSQLQIARSIGFKAMACHKQKKFQQAESLYKQALSIFKKRVGEDHPDAVTLLNNLGCMYASQKLYPDAQHYLERALTIRQARLSPNAPELESSLKTLAKLYIDQGKLKDAEHLYEQHWIKIKGNRETAHLCVAASLNRLANEYGKSMKAEQLYKRALGILTECPKKDHKDVLTCLYNLSGLYRQEHRYDEAETALKQALSVAEANFGPDHEKVAASLSRLAYLYQLQKKYVESEKLYKRALDIREKKLGADHPAVADLLNNFGGLYVTRGSYDAAEPLLKRALSIREANPGKNGLALTNSLMNLAYMYEEQGRYSEAEALVKRASEIHLTRPGANLRLTLGLKLLHDELKQKIARNSDG